MQLLANIFLSLSISVVLYQARGAGQTALAPSWTGKLEAEDYDLVLRAGLDDLKTRMVAEGADQATRNREVKEVFLCVSAHRPS